MRRTALKLLITATCLAGVSPVRAEDDPGRGVARISLMNGDVSVRRGDSGDWVAAAVNAPLVVEDSVLTGSGSRAEVQFDWADMARLFSNTEVRLAQLEYRRYLLQLARGTVTFSVLRDSDADVEISTPSVSVRPRKKGLYRITVREDGDSEITVREGEAEIFTPRGAEQLREGKTMLARGSASDPEFQIVREIAYDNWDRWNENRDRDLRRSRSYRYVNSSIYGADDLDAYGYWANIPPYGWCWYPRVGYGWAPYHHGRWVWLDWYGWSWVSYDPWGWAPFHYGRWFYQRPYGWCWYPGVYHRRYFWRPALVAFFGFGGHRGVSFGVGFGFGRIGWIPLAPFETYHPWYGRRYYRGFRNATYINNSVNIVNNTNVVNIYRNARINNAVVAVDSSQFARGNTGNLVRVSGNELRRVGLVKGMVPVTPGRESLRLSNREVKTASLSRTMPEGRFFSRRQPAQVDRVPFEQQRRSIADMSRRTFSTPAPQSGGSQVVRLPRPTGRGEPARGGSSVRSTDRNTGTGWRRVGEAPRSNPAVVGTVPRADTSVRAADQNANGWRRFGEPVTRRAPSPGGSIPRAVDRSRGGSQPAPSVRSGGADSSGWHQFGEPASGVERQGGLIRRTPTTRQAEPRQLESPGRLDRGAPGREPSDGWRRFNPEQGSRAPEAIYRRGEPRGNTIERQRSESPRGYEPPSYGSPGRSLPRYEPRGRSEPLRVSPPIVRERGRPDFGNRGSVRSPSPAPGGGVRAAPRSLPRSGGGAISRSAPRSGGSARSSGGGGHSRRSR